MNKSLRDFKNTTSRRQYIENKLITKLSHIAHFSFSETDVAGKNIENLIGATQIPLGIAGPLTLQTTNYKLLTTYIPLATTEGALVASVSRGCKAIIQSDGAKVELEDMGITRGPVFRTNGIEHCRKTIRWVSENFEQLKEICKGTSSHLNLKWIDFSFTGRNLFVRFLFDTADAMGMNMATIATDKMARAIEKATKAKCISIAGNFDVDKKASWLNFLFGRGKKVWAEVTIKAQVCLDILGVSPKEIAEVVYRKCQIGSSLSGSMGFNAQYANVIAAIFIATGQDPAHVVEGSLGVTSAEVLESGDLYFSIYLPSLIIGTVGGGTSLPTQSEALEILGVRGKGNVLKFACVVAAAVLAGELSLIASQAEGTLAKAHIKYGRKGRK